MEEKKNVLLSIKDLEVKFRVRGRILTAIRGVSLDIYENESIAIVGESGSGKSVFTKTFAGMLDSNGFISNGQIIFNDEELADTVVKLDGTARKIISHVEKKLNEYSKLELGAATYRKILELETEKKERGSLSSQELAESEGALKELEAKRTDAFNLKQTLDPSRDKDRIKETAQSIREYDAQIGQICRQRESVHKLLFSTGACLRLLK